MFFLTLAWTASQITGPAQVGLVVAAGALPRAALMLFGGMITDRSGPRRIVMVSDATRCLVLFTGALALVGSQPTLWILIAVALVVGVADSLFMPAVGALPPRITAFEQLARVQGMRTLCMRIGNTTGPPAAGVALAAGGTAVTFAVAGMAFVASLVLLATVRTAAAPSSAPRAERTNDTSPWRGLVDGLRYIRSHRVLAPLMVVAAIAELGFIGPINVGLVLLSDRRGWGASGMGLIIGAFTAGASASAVLITFRGHVPRAGLVSGWCLLFASGALAALGFVPALPAAVAAGALIGLFVGMTSAVLMTLIQTYTDATYLGRVSSVATLATIGIAPLSYPATGIAIGVIGSERVFAACGLLSAAAAVLSLVISPLRRAELAARRGAVHADRCARKWGDGPAPG